MTASSETIIRYTQGKNRKHRGSTAIKEFKRGSLLTVHSIFVLNHLNHLKRDLIHVRQGIMAREDCKECCSKPRVLEEKMLSKNVVIPIDQWLNSPHNTLMPTEGMPDRQAYSTMEQIPNHKQGFATAQESCESSALDVELMSVGVNNDLSNQEKTVKLCHRADLLHDDEACHLTDGEYRRNPKRKKRHSRIRKVRRQKYWMFHHAVNSHDSCCWGILTHRWMGKRDEQFQRNTERSLPFSADTTSHESTTRSTSFPITDTKDQGRNLPNNIRNQERRLSADEPWPFLMRFPVSCFSICMGFGIQTVLWKTLSTIKWLPFMHIPKYVNLILWCLGSFLTLILFITYISKCILYPRLIRWEFTHPIRSNFFFAPWIACMWLTVGTPDAIATTINPIFWLLLMAPIMLLNVRIYGQWLSEGRRLSESANPGTHLSLVGNFVGALLAATTGWKEIARFFWVIGLVHYLVLIVTLYQRSPTAPVLPKNLRPYFFLFVSAPSSASASWCALSGRFDMVSRSCLFLAFYLYMLLIVKINFFRGFKFSVAWWAYAFPLTSFANASLHYSVEVGNPGLQGFAVIFSFVACVTVFMLCLLTVLHIFWGTMFPNDLMIIPNEKDGRSEKEQLAWTQG
ncbi:hypothetical protein KP509_14G072500 [Ceratopteris richardii]|uniref:Uncharacterized protein n=1 Tax=Ceratopteris richardii TaxID=49495 RepID=A0A8T2TB47_CERRI|nr:hypothetical protein KP509_14G072500 [Ceratopteris richardii]